MSARWYEELYEHFDDYDDEPYTQNTATEVDFIAALFPDGRALRVLDIGCGTGRHSLELARRGHNVSGVDLSSSMIERARAKAASEDLNISFAVRDARDLGFEREFDVALILCEGGFSLVETDQMDRAIVAGAARALSPGGICILTAPHAAHMLANDPGDGSFDRETRREAFELTTKDENGSPRTLSCNQRYYDTQELRSIFEDAGLGDVQFFRVTETGFEPGEPSEDDFELGIIARI